MNINSIKAFLLESYIHSVLEDKRKNYNLDNELNSSFDDGWGIPKSLNMNEYKILQIFKYNKNYESL